MLPQKFNKKIKRRQTADQGGFASSHEHWNARLNHQTPDDMMLATGSLAMTDVGTPASASHIPSLSNKGFFHDEK